MALPYNVRRGHVNLPLRMSHSRGYRSQTGLLVGLLGALGVGLLAFGCSAKEHPAFIGPVVEGAGRAGAPGGEQPDTSADAGSGDSSGDVPPIQDPPGSSTTSAGPVYVLAPLNPDTGPLAFSPIEHPEAYSFGLCSTCFDAQFLGTKLVYQQSPRQPLFSFERDLNGSPEPKSTTFPLTAPNDPVVATPACTAGPQAFLTGPNGELYYQCPADGTWYSGSEQIYKGAAELLMIGSGGLVLVIQDEAYGVLNINDGQVATVAGVNPLTRYAQRWNSKGFHVVQAESKGPVLREIHPDGSSALVGTFKDTVQGGTGGGVLTEDDHLVVIGFSDNAQTKVLIERVGLDGNVTPVYSGAVGESYLSLQYARLITAR